jgi:hypothetical protein
VLRQQQSVLQGEVSDSLAGKNSKLCSPEPNSCWDDMFVSNHLGLTINVGNGADKESVSEGIEESNECFEFS